jgi:hypothetical protein
VGYNEWQKIGPTGDELAVLDLITEATVAGDSSFAEIRALYKTTENLHIPPKKQ